MNKAFFKRYSTYANGITLVLGAVMVYLPDLVPDGSQAAVMAACSGLVALCQFIKQGAQDV